MNTQIRRSPLFYVGDKYKLLRQLVELFPREINNFYEPFVGGGSVFLNVIAKRYYLNDNDENLINLHKFLIGSSNNSNLFFKGIEKILKKYSLSRSYLEDIIPASLKRKWKKTYIARFNKSGYQKLKSDFNTSKNNPLILYILLIFGFNRMLRFNRAGEFNIPVGNVDFNKNVEKALRDYFYFVKDRKIILTSEDYKSYFLGREFKKNDFIYIDPPYLITASEYNKYWDQKSEQDLLSIIDSLNKRGVKFALSNVTHYNGLKNRLLIDWMRRYKVHGIKSNYISYHNNSIKNLKEVLITNYD